MKFKARATAILTILGGVAIASFYLFTTPSLEIYGGDCCIYYELARSLLHEQKYWFNFEPHSTYPPGQPIFLAGLMYFFGESFSTLIKFITIAGLIGVIGSYLFIQRLYDSRTALIVALFTLSSSFFYLWLTAGLTSDVPYFAVTAWALYYFDMANQSKKTRKVRIAFALTCMLTLYCIFLRSIGITFVAGIFLWSVSPLFQLNNPLSRKETGNRLIKWGPIIVLCIGALFLWSNWSKSQHPPPPEYDYMSSYSKQLFKKDVHDIASPQITISQLPARAMDMLVIRSANAGKIIFSLPWVDRTWTNPLTLIPALLIFLGWIWAIKQNGSLLEWYFVSYIGLLALWPFDENGRFLFSIQPFLYLYLILGIKVIYDAIINKQFQRFYPFVTLIAVIMIVYILTAKVFTGEASSQNLLSLVFWFTVTVTTIIVQIPDSTLSHKLFTNKTIPGLTIKLPLIGSIALAVLLLSGWSRITHYAYDNINRSPSHISVKKETAGAVEWINANTSPNDVIVADEYAIVHRLTKRKTLRFPLTTDPSLIWDTIKNAKVKYIVVPNEIQYEYFMPSAENRFILLQNLKPENLSLVFDFDYGKIFHVTEQIAIN